MIKALLAVVIVTASAFTGFMIAAVLAANREQEREETKMRIKVKLDSGAFMPTRAHNTDAGMDIRSREEKYIHPHSSAVFHTGVHIEIPEGYAGFLKSKSGLNVNYGLTGEGVIDSGYTGEICVKLYNSSDNGYQIDKGQKITQLVILPILTPEPVLVLGDLAPTERGDGGFGSTGKF